MAGGTRSCVRSFGRVTGQVLGKVWKPWDFFPPDFTCKGTQQKHCCQQVFVANIASAMQKARNAKKWTQKELATQLGLPLSIIRNYENGKAIPNGSLLGKIGRKLGVKLKK